MSKIFKIHKSSPASNHQIKKQQAKSEHCKAMNGSENANGREIARTIKWIIRGRLLISINA
jgi:hypothetical protein